VKSRR